MSLPLIRHSERVDFKRCPKKWYWHWRKGLIPKAKKFGALDLGTWIHAALAAKYTERITMQLAFDGVTAEALYRARDNLIPEHEYEKAIELANLGMAMAVAYEKHYGLDEGVKPIQAEVPLEFPISLDGALVAIHKLKPDLLYEDARDGGIWLMEHKTAASIRLEHLVIDDQARPYVAMAEMSLRKAGLLKRGQQFKGIMYNFLRKAVPDERPTDDKGRYLNKNGSISKSQPPPYFVRHPITLTNKAKAITLRRLRTEAYLVTSMRQAIVEKRVEPAYIPKTPHSSCPKFCDYFTMCVTEEQGGDIRDMERNMYTRQDPYVYEEETTDITTSFEFG